MTIQELTHEPPARLAAALEEFEAQFAYPLGPGRSFRISHGADYARFFRAMGDARVFVAELDDRVVGSVGVSLRTLTTPDSVTRGAYIGDLKISPAARGGVVLHRLARAAYDWARPQVTAAFGVVMDGTLAVPSAYTGRAGLPAFFNAGALQVFRIPSDASAADECVNFSDADGQHLYKKLSAGRAFATGGNPAERSGIKPQWFGTPDSHACGRIEDTTRAKRLLVSDGTEMHSAHLACLAWRTPAAATVLIRAGQRRAADHGFRALFLAVDARDAADVTDAVDGLPVTIAGATVYAANLPDGLRWSVSSSEI